MVRAATGLGVTFFVIALLAGLLGFIAIGSLAWAGARLFFFAFLILVALACLGGLCFRRQSSWES
jgi:uncharacterized membrane protein YtjA (UPF0391 family)